MEKRRILCISFIVMILFFSIFSFNTLEVEAKNVSCPMCGNSHDTSKLKFPNNWCYEMSCKVYGGDIISKTATEVLEFNVKGTTFNGIWTRGKYYYNSLAVLGKILVTTYVMYDLMTKSAMDNLTPEHIFKGFMRLAVGILLIDNGYEFIGAASEFFTDLFRKIGGKGVSATPGGCNFGKMASANIFDAFLDASFIFIPWLIMLAASVIISVTCWSRVLDITVRIIFAPIGMADIINDGTKSAGWKYFKRLCASLLQGSVIVATAKSYGMVVNVMSKMDGLAAWAMPIIISFVMIFILFKASAFAADIVG